MQCLVTFIPYKDDHRLWGLQKLSVWAYNPGLMDAGSDAVHSSARVWQRQIRKELFLIPGGHYMPSVEVF